MARAPDASLAPTQSGRSRDTEPAKRQTPRAAFAVFAACAILFVVAVLAVILGGSSTYPWHTGIVATTFWVGEVFDPTADDGSQVISAYDDNWYANYGGCDGVIIGGVCGTEARSASNDYFPSSMRPKQNPFYLDLPFDDVNDPTAFHERGNVIPWAGQPQYANRLDDASVSLMKNRWVELRRDGHTCYGQIADAGPGEYSDARYVFGTDDPRPRNARYGGAGLDVSPALNGCLHFSELNGDTDRVNWRFVEFTDVPDGPWLRLYSNDDTVNH